MQADKTLILSWTDDLKDDCMVVGLVELLILNIAKSSERLAALAESLQEIILRFKQ